VTIWSLGWAASASLVGLAGAQTEYALFVVEAFEPTGLRECYVRDVNESGRACGTSTFESFYAGFTWTEATDKIQLPLIWTEDINNIDQVAGDAAVHDLNTGNTTFIPGLNATYATPFVHGLNDVGTVVGHAKGPGSDSDEVNRTPIIWDSVQGVRGVAVAGARELLRVNNANVAVGNLRFSAGDSEAWVYDVDTAESVFLHARHQRSRRRGGGRVERDGEPGIHLVGYDGIQVHAGAQWRRDDARASVRTQ
jgi:hypothetical protein